MFKLETPDLPAAEDGFLAGVNVITGTGHQLFNVSEYELPLDGFNRDVPDPGTDKVFDKLETNSTVLFEAYRGADSPLLLGENPQAIIDAAYKRAESHYVGGQVQEQLLNPKATDITPTPGTAVTNPRLALGLLEQWARDNSTFAATLSGNALVLTLVEDALNLETWASALGTPVVLAGGYGTTGPGGLIAPAGTGWLYIHGRINVWTGTPGGAEATDYRNNRKIALAEGLYAASVDSFVAAVLVGTN